MPSQNLEAHATIGVHYEIVFMADGAKIAEYKLSKNAGEE